MSLFDSRQAAAISIEKATAWVKENLADLYDGVPAEVSAAQVRSLPLVEVGVLGLVGPARDDGHDPLSAQGVEQPSGRVRFVGDDCPRLPARPTSFAGAQSSFLEQRADADLVVTLPT